ncbi:MAG: SDR family NAD(P)-dependent oxidoreductase [Candidatus Azotimanducaceae bacterium WSBS_2022_MAG_OTU7]
MEIKGKNALITGAAAGIGQATAFALADAGAAGIALVDLDEKGLADTANIIEQKGAKALTGKVDVTDAIALTTFFEEAESALGGLDIVPPTMQGQSVESLFGRLHLLRRLIVLFQ